MKENIKVLISEEEVNEKIKEDLPVTCEEMSYDEAKKSGAIGLFTSKKILH